MARRSRRFRRKSNVQRTRSVRVRPQGLWLNYTYPKPAVIRYSPIVRTARRQVVVTQQKQPLRKQPVVSRGTLRLEIPKNICMRRKAYKKSMLKQIAAQVQKSGGKGALTKWRNRRRNATNITYHCGA